MEATETQIDVASSLSKPSVVERIDGLGGGGEDRAIKISGSKNLGDPPTWNRVLTRLFIDLAVRRCLHFVASVVLRQRHK